MHGCSTAGNSIEYQPAPRATATCASGCQTASTHCVFCSSAAYQQTGPGKPDATDNERGDCAHNTHAPQQQHAGHSNASSSIRRTAATCSRSAVRRHSSDSMTYRNSMTTVMTRAAATGCQVAGAHCACRSSTANHSMPVYMCNLSLSLTHTHTHTHTHSHSCSLSSLCHILLSLSLSLTLCSLTLFRFSSLFLSSSSPSRFWHAGRIGSYPSFYLSPS